MASLEALPILLKELRLSTIGKCWEALAQQALDGTKITHSGGCQAQALGQPIKQWTGQVFFETFDLPADRTLGQIQFVGRLGKAQMAGCSFKAL